MEERDYNIQRREYYNFILIILKKKIIDKICNEYPNSNTHLKKQNIIVVHLLACGSATGPVEVKLL